LAVPSLPGFFGAVYVGVFEMGITFVLWLKALRLSRTTAQVSNLIYLTPFFALVFINLFVGERILASTVIGLAFIVSGILLQKYPFQQKDF
jgi:drug/metabolite transporter (DMT)-like permease